MEVISLFGPDKQLRLGRDRASAKRGNSLCLAQSGPARRKEAFVLFVCVHVSDL